MLTQIGMFIAYSVGIGSDAGRATGTSTWGAVAMYDHELSVAIQQERERAIREARLHDRIGFQAGPSLARRLRSSMGQWVAGLARRMAPGAGAVAPASDARHASIDHGRGCPDASRPASG
jgi:hypothetical protein